VRDVSEIIESINIKYTLEEIEEDKLENALNIKEE
jgi:hypothetical protein